MPLQRKAHGGGYADVRICARPTRNHPSPRTDNEGHCDGIKARPRQSRTITFVTSSHSSHTLVLLYSLAMRTFRTLPNVYCTLCDQYFVSNEARTQHVQFSENHPLCRPCGRRFINKNALRVVCVFAAVTSVHAKPLSHVLASEFLAQTPLLCRLRYRVPHSGKSSSGKLPSISHNCADL